MLGNSDWDNCLKRIAVDADLTSAERECFFVRFAEKHKTIFQNCSSVEQEIKNIKNIKEDDSYLISYKRHMTKVYKKIANVLDIEFKTHNNKAEELYAEIIKLVGHNDKKPDFQDLKERPDANKIRKSNLQELESQFANELILLNYSSQKEKFRKDFVDSKCLAAAYLIRVSYDNNTVLQHLLVKSLSSFLLYKQTPKFLSFKITRSLSVDELCNELHKSLGFPICNSFDELINNVRRLSQTQPIVICLFDIFNMGNQISVFIEKFWYPLVNRVAEENWMSNDFRLLLFLAADREIRWTLNKSQPGCPIMLPVLEEITIDDVNSWLRNPFPYRFKNRCFRENQTVDWAEITKCEGNAKKTPLGTDAYKALEIVCQAFGFAPDLGQFMEYWRLNGDLVK